MEAAEVTMMVMAVVPHEEAQDVLNALINARYTATFVESRGGLLRQSQVTLFVATQKERVDEVVGIVRDNCRSEVRVDAAERKGGGSSQQSSTTARVGGAVVFVWPLEKFEAC
jgi:uncharacterized protein YaaQ